MFAVVCCRDCVFGFDVWFPGFRCYLFVIYCLFGLLRCLCLWLWQMVSLTLLTCVGLLVLLMIAFVGLSACGLGHLLFSFVYVVYFAFVDCVVLWFVLCGVTLLFIFVLLLFAWCFACLLFA